MENGHGSIDDSRIELGTRKKRPAPEPPRAFHRSASEVTFSHLQHMEKNYSKLGENGYNPVKEVSPVNGKIKVASLSSLQIKDLIETDNEKIFVGRRDMRDPDSIKERQIVSRRGSVRGFKNRVRAGIATFIDNEETCSELDEDFNRKRNYRQEEKCKIIIYTTSMTVVRQSAERCKVVRNILQTHMVRYEERDMFMSAENQKELSERLGHDLCAIELPQVFADGVHIGGCDELRNLNETGELRDLLRSFTKINVRSHCDKCGGYRYLPCTFCHGSKKSLHRNEFTEEFCALRCMQCDENGLVRCDDCIDQQE